MNIPPIPRGLSNSLNQRHNANPSSPSPRDPDSDSDWDASDEEREQLKRNGALQASQRSSPKARLPQVDFATPQENAYSGLDAFAASMSAGNKSSHHDDTTPVLPVRSPRRSSPTLGAPVMPTELPGIDSSASVWDSVVQETTPVARPSASRARPPVPTSKSWLNPSGQYTPEQNPSQPVSERYAQPPALPSPMPSTVNSQNIWSEQSSQAPVNAAIESFISPPSRPPPIPKAVPGEGANPWAEAEANWASKRATAEASNPQAPPYMSTDELGSAPAVSSLVLDTPHSPGWSTEKGSMPESSSKKQRNEVYQVKHIRYGPVSSSESYRSWPILMQNANGPCPLLALVNALVLSTPADIITGLIETLRVREQVSLGLLLDAVVDELIYRQSGGKESQLPDVGDLYAFLVNLHTGMNVNPRFVTNSAVEHAGDFEETREMQLYATFQIPLIHGWLPEPQSEAHSAFERSAPTFEDAQNLLLREEWLECKLEELSIEEQTQYMDVAPIKGFLKEWPTQLTTIGLAMINKTMQPGTFSILFRNDHFSTLYKEPRTGQLMALVTDAGYTTHDEIIWENLVDITGIQSEYFSGDFRSVSHSQNAQTADHDGPGWTTVESKNSRPKRDGSGNNNVANAASLPQGFSALSLDATDAESAALMQRLAAEQEQADLDFAMALQLQEEEEERNRTDQAARQRENQLSEQFVASETNRNPTQEATPPPQPPRPGAPLPRRPPPVTTTRIAEADEIAPPPYEQATASPPYSPSSSLPRQQRPQSMQALSPFMMQQQQGGGISTSQSPTGRRRLSARPSYLGERVPGSPQTPRGPMPATPGGGSKEEGDEKCLVM